MLSHISVDTGCRHRAFRTNRGSLPLRYIAITTVVHFIIDSEEKKVNKVNKTEVPICVGQS